MVLHKLSQIYKQYPGSIILLLVVVCETRYGQYNYFWYYRHYITEPFTNIIMRLPFPGAGAKKV